MIQDQELTNKFVEIIPITKGWSGDKKYCVTSTEGIKYLLRISPVERLEERKFLFDMQKQVAAMGIPMCTPIEFGTCVDGVYSIQSWIDGEDLETILPLLSDTEQYKLGYISGEIVRKMHTISAPENQEEWEIRFNRKTDYKIQKYHECGLHFNGDENILFYVENNRHLLKNRPQCFQHGDYHIGNMMLEKGELKIIDFDRYDFGDPWEEFNRIVWSAAASPHFATGQLQGYFGGEPPAQFFKLLAFYIASNTLSSIYWAIPFGQSDLEVMMKQSQDVLLWFDNMNNPVPLWYLKESTQGILNYITTCNHYDALIDEIDDPLNYKVVDPALDPEPLKAYMDKWDGQAFIDALKLTPAKSVLEIGVGTGRLALRVYDKCGNFTGIDISPKTVERAKANLQNSCVENLHDSKNINLICGDYLTYEFDKTFDVIYSSLTFMHIKDKQTAIQKVWKLLNTVGRFVLSISKSQQTEIEYGTRRIPVFPDTPEEIFELLTKAGFIIEQQFETEFALVFIAEKGSGKLLTTK